MAVTSALVDSTQRTGSNGTTSTVTGVLFGTAFSGRVITVQCAANFYPSAATIGGVTATIRGSTAFSGSGTFTLSAVVPTGTSGNVVATFSSSDSLLTFSVVALNGASSAVPSATIDNGTGSGTINIGAGGAIVAFSLSVTAGTWTGASLLATDTSLGVAYSTASFDNSGGAITGRAVSYTGGTPLSLITLAFDDAGGGGGQNLTPSLFTDGDTFYSPTVVGPQVLTPSLFTNSNSFFAPSVVNRGDLIGTLQANNNTIPTNFSAAGSVAVSVGDLIASVVCQQTNLTVTGVTDNLGNTYTAQNAGTDAGNVTGRLFYSIVTNAGTLTSVTAACTTSANDGVHIVAVFKGAFSAIDKNIANITSDVTSPFTCPSSGTLTQADEIVIGWGVASHNTSWSATSPNLMALQLANSTTIKAAIGYQTVAATSAVAPAFTAGSNPGQAVLGTLSFSMAAGSATQNLTPSLFTNSQTFYGPTVTRGAVGLTPSLVTNSQTFYGPTARNLNTIAPALVTNGQTFYSATVTPGEVTLTPSLFTNTQTFFGPSVAAGAVTLSPSLYTNAQTFYGPVVSQGGVTLAPSLLTNAQTFHGPTVTRGAVGLTPSLFTNGQTFYGPTVGQGTILLPSLFADGDIFYSPSVSPGAVSLSPSLFTDADTFFSAAVSPVYSLAPSLVADADTFYGPSVSATYSVQPDLYVDGDIFYAPAVLQASDETLAPEILVNSNIFYSCTVRFAPGTWVPVTKDNETWTASGTVTSTWTPATITREDWSS